MSGSGFLYVAQPGLACFSWTVTAEDTENGVDASASDPYTIYTIEVSLRPGCRNTYWLSFQKEGEPPGWTSDVLDETGHIIPWGTEFVLSGVVTYYFSYIIHAPLIAPTGEEAAITLHISANDKYNEQETKDVETTTTVFRGSAPDEVEVEEDPFEGETYVVLEWDQTQDLALDFQHYEVHKGMSDDYIPVVTTLVDTIDDKTITEYNVTGLSEGTTYYFEVRVVDSEGESTGGNYLADSNEVEGTTQGYNAPPPAPVLDEPWVVTNESAKINWTKCEEADFAYYQLHASLEEGFNATPTNSWAKFYDADITGGEYLGLWENQTIYVKVRVFDSGNKRNISNEVSFKTLDHAPHPSELFEAVNISYHKAELFWEFNRNTDFNSYQVHYSLEEDFTPDDSTLYETLDDLRDNSSKVEGLLDGQTYYFIVRTVDNGSFHSDSNQIEVHTPALNRPPVASVIEEPEEADVSETWLKVRWTKNEEADFDRYELYMDTEDEFEIDEGEGELVKTIRSASTNYYKVRDLDPGTEYYFCLRTWDTGDDNNDPLFNDSAILMMETEALPEPVVLDTPWDLNATRITLEWSQNEDDDFEKYELHMSQTSGFAPSSGTRVYTEVPLTIQSQTSYEVSGLEERMAYHFIVRVIDDGGSFADSNEVTATTENGPPPPVRLSEIFSIRDDSFSVMWDRSEVVDFDRYEVHISQTAGFNPDASTLLVSLDNPQDTYHDFTELEPDSEYFVVLRLYDTGEEHSDSNIVEATTDKLKVEADDGDDSSGLGLLATTLALLGMAMMRRRRP